MTGRSKGAALSDLFWYWLSPGAEMHPEHLELGERYQQIARFTRKILAVSKKDIEELINQYHQDPLELSLGEGKEWVHTRLRDRFMLLWADFFYQLVFREPCSPTARSLIVNHASDVVNALKCCKLRDMNKRQQLTLYLLEKIRNNEFPYTFPIELTELEKAYYLQGTFFNTAIVQMSEAMTHLVLAISQHPGGQEQLKSRGESAYLDNVINESLRLYPLFGIAHRISTESLDFNGEKLSKNTVFCFNYPNYHKMGYENADEFIPDRWTSCPVKETNFIPFGVSGNRSCPAQGLAMVSMKILTMHLINNYYFTSPIEHTRSLPNRGPCIVMRKSSVASRFGIKVLVIPLMKLYDHWENLFRSLIQLVLGAVMVLHARKLKLCEHHFQNTEAAKSY